MATPQTPRPRLHAAQVHQEVRIAGAELQPRLPRELRTKWIRGMSMVPLKRLRSQAKKTLKTSGESQSKPIGTKMVVIPERTGLRRRISAAISGWDRPLTFIYPGFDWLRSRVDWLNKNKYLVCLYGPKPQSDSSPRATFQATFPPGFLLQMPYGLLLYVKRCSLEKSTNRKFQPFFQNPRF